MVSLPVMQNSKDTTPPRVWIEIEPAKSYEENKARAEMGTKLLRKLYGESPTRFGWSDREQRFTLWSGGGFTVLDDNGEWFNLTNAAK